MVFVIRHVVLLKRFARSYPGEIISAENLGPSTARCASGLYFGLPVPLPFICHAFSFGAFVLQAALLYEYTEIYLSFDHT